MRVPFVLVLLCVLLLSCTQEAPRHPVVVLGADGASWDLIFQYSRDGRLPHLAKLIARGSGGYVNSLLWKRFSHRRRGYFSPIVWTSIATGKRPDQHGVEDFVLPLPEERDFFLLGGAKAGVLELPLLQAGSLLIEGAAAAGGSVAVEVRLEGQSLARLEFTDRAAVHAVPFPAEALPAGRARLELAVTPPGADVPALRVRRLGLLDEAGRLLRWMHPHQNGEELRGGWHWAQQGRGVPAASYHRLARPIWEIASEQGRSVAVVGWWGSAPARPVKGSLITDWAGVRHKASPVGLTHPPELLQSVEATLEQTVPLMETWRAELSGALDCPCLGAAQSRIYLQHRHEDELRLRLAEQLAAEKPDLLMVYLRLIDAASHQFLAFDRPEAREKCRAPGCDPEKLATLVPGSYELLDEAVGRLMKVVPEDATWLLVSDHGQVSHEGQPGLHQNNGFILLSGPEVRSGLLFEAQVTDVAPTLLYLLDLPIGSDMTGRLLSTAFQPQLLERRPPRWVVTYEDLLEPLPAGNVAVDEKIAAEQLEAIEALGYMK